MDLATASSVLRLLADPTRVRLLALLECEELTVAELAAVLQLAQPRVSTHLAKLKEAGLVRDRRAGVSAYYRANNEGDEAQHSLVVSLRETIDDALLREDAARLPGVLANRAREEGAAVEPFNHRNLGFRSEQLADYAKLAGLNVISCTRLSRERKAPHFEVISLLATKPAAV
jgi:DNA-binding transcriptional ArsR family regulator